MCCWPMSTRSASAAAWRRRAPCIREAKFDAIIVDIFLAEGGYGLSLLPDIKELQPNTPAIVISGMAGTDEVMKALKAGAYDMLMKPFNMIDVVNVVARAVEKKQMADENRRLMDALRQERDLLENRVQGATRDLQEKVEILRLMNQQLATMFEMSQMNSEDGSSEGMLRRVFELLRRMIDFEGAYCVVYDIVARGISLSYAEGEAATNSASRWPPCSRPISASWSRSPSPGNTCPSTPSRRPSAACIRRPGPRPM